MRIVIGPYRGVKFDAIGVVTR